jgi:integrase
MTRIAEFLAQYDKINTQRSYKTALRLFFDVVYDSSRVNDDAHYEDLAERYLTELQDGDRSLSTDMIALANTLADKPPLTARSRIAAVKEFFVENGYDLTPRDVRNIRRRVPKGYAQTEENEMSRETLKTILQHCDLRGRAIFLVLVSSGMRVGEALSITLSDINLDKKPAQIRIKAGYTKTREARTAFISGEAAEAVKAWLTVRTAHMTAAENRNKGLVAHGLSTEKKKDDDRVFPYEYGTINKIWETAVKKAGFYSKDEVTERNQTHIHQLRKYFRTMTATKIPVDVAESLMGHSRYLSRAYRKHTRDQIAEYYLKAEPALTIFSIEDPEVKGKVAMLSEENEVLKRRLMSLEEQNEVTRILLKQIENAHTISDEPLFDILENPEKNMKRLKRLKEIMASLPE